MPEGWIRRAGFVDECYGALRVEAEGSAEGTHFRSELLAVGGPGVYPEEAVGAFGSGDDFRLGEKVHGRGEFGLSLVDFAGGVAVEDGSEGLLEGGDGRLTCLPGGCRSEEDAVPVLVSEGFAIVVPEGVELAAGTKALAVAGKLLDVGEAEIVVRVDLAVVVDGRGDPGFDSRVGEGVDDLAETTGRVWRVAPGDGDGGVLEGLRHGF